MKTSKLFIVFTLVSLTFFSYSQTNKKADDVTGFWYTADKDGIIKIYRAKNGKYYGKLYWIDEPNDKDGNPKLDVNNPDPSLRNKPILGSVFMKGFEYKGDHLWVNGTVYDSRYGLTYSAKMWLVNKNQLDLRGFLLFSLIGKTTSWTRKL